MLFKESLYGWGVCDIPMPRSAHDIFADRRKNNNRHLNHRRPEQPGILAFISGLCAHDIPWLQILLQSIIAMLCVVFVFLLSKMIPVFQDKQIPKPVDITIKVIEDIPPPKPPPVQKAPVPPKKENIVQVQRTAPVIKAKPASAPEKIQPAVSVARKIKRKPQRTVKNKLPQTVSFDKKAQPEEINILIPREHKHKYAVKPTKISKTVHKSRKPEFNPLPLEDQKVAVSSSNVFKKKYKINNANRDHVVPSKQTVSSITPVDKPVAVIYPSKRSQKKYRVKTSGHGRVMPSDKSVALLTPENVSTETVSYANHAQKKYTIDKVNHNRVATPANILESKAFASDLPATTDEIALSKPGQTVVRYASKKNDTAYRSKTSPNIGNQSQFLNAKKDNMIEEESLTRPMINARGRPVPKANKLKGDVVSVNPHRQSHDFSGSIDEIDPAYLISLKALAVCLDPEEEFYLKTKLATLLSGPAKCESNGVYFFFKYTETAYNIKVDIYNPEERLLKDRCSALNLAIKGVMNLKAKGVIQ
jgi:hypothetical protein